MKIIGVGASFGFLTEEAISEIKNAKIIFGSKRAIELAKEYIMCETHVLSDYKLSSLPNNAVVLSTGDPMFSGLGKYAKKEDIIISGISSFQLACCRLHICIEDISIITAHSRSLEIVKKKLKIELENGKDVFILPDNYFGVCEIAEFIKSLNLKRRIILCEALGYSNERIVEGNEENPPPNPLSNMYCVVITDVR